MNNMKSMKHPKDPFDISCMDTSTIGERGQIVIPKKVRDQLKAKQGDKFLFIFNGETIMLAPINSLKMFTEHFQKHLKEIEKIIKKESN